MCVYRCMYIGIYIYFIYVDIYEVEIYILDITEKFVTI